MPHISAFDYTDEPGKPQLLVFLKFDKGEEPPEGEMPTCIVEWRPGYKPAQKEDLSKSLSNMDLDPNDGVLDEVALVLAQKHFRGEVAFTFKWTPKGQPDPVEFQRALSLGGPLNAPQNRQIDDPVPQLSTAINAALSSAEAARVSTATQPSTPDDYGKLIEAALNQIHKNLQIGLGDFWQAPECRTADGKKALCEVTGGDLDALTLSELEECWAQLVSEMFVGTPYAGPGSYMNALPNPNSPGAWNKVHRQDSTYFRMVKTRVEGSIFAGLGVKETAEDPSLSRPPELVCGLVYACQQLSTAILMTRSKDYLGIADDPVDSGAPLPHGKFNGSFAKAATVSPATGLQIGDLGWLAPGASYFVNEYRHVATVLRAFRSKRIQLLDPGGWNLGDNPFSKPKLEPNAEFHKINWDTIAASKISQEQHINAQGKLEGRKQTFAGVLLPPPITQANKQKLIEMINLLQNARPLGVLRLVVFDRNSKLDPGKRVRYVSPRLRMHEGDGAEITHYPITRLFAALRGCPHADVLDIRWQIFVPGGNPALRNAFNNGRTQNWWLRSGAGSKAVEDEERELKQTFELCVEPNGLPRFYQRQAQGKVKWKGFDPFLDQFNDVTAKALLPNSAPQHPIWTTCPNIATVQDSEIPEYFRRTADKL